MTTPRDARRPTPRRLRGWPAVALGLGLTLAPGCRWLNGNRDSADPPVAKASGDPLMGARIPKQDVPTRETAGADPILTKPAGRSRPAAGEADDLPPRPANKFGTESYRPSLATTNAALAAGRADADLPLDRRTGQPVTPAGGTTSGPVPLKPSGFGPTFDDAKRRLTSAYDAKVEGPTRRGDSLVVRVTVPITGDTPGSRTYEGEGASATAAAQNALEQVQADFGKK